LKVAFLTPEEGWFSGTIPSLMDEVGRRGHETRVFHRHEDLERGELLFLLSYLRIVPPEFLSLHKRNVVIHGSDLPKGRGFSPLSWQVSEDARKITFTLFEASEEADVGDYYLKRSMPLNGTELFHEWRAKSAAFIKGMALDFLDRYDEWQAMPQEGEVTHYRKRKRIDEEISPRDILSDVFDKLRASDPNRYPVWFFHRGRRYNLRLEVAE